MSDNTINPDTHRIVQTVDGTVSIPREQAGVPLSEYFRNAELPDNIERTIVYSTPNGPVLAKPDPVRWNEHHNKKARAYAGKIKTLIEEKGYYSKTMNIYATRLADETGHPREEMKAVISDAFKAEYGDNPFTYLQNQRELQGLPVRESSTRQQFPERG